ncbi:alpha/beta hydrolase, partial [Romboutsia sp.]|uniref:alpha/beta fold hydrolase n=1 Tax=Romboutsia sp. TaxID=1965302 RepID=UPI002C4E0AB7
EEISGTFRKVVKEDLKKDLNLIDVPTLIIWGKKDRSTPLEHGKILHKGIKKSKFIVFEKLGHGIPKTHPEVISKVIRNNIEFIK